MANTIEFSPKYEKWIFIFNGIINSAIGARTLFHPDSTLGWKIVGIALLIGGPFMIVYGVLLFWLSPKVCMDNQTISIKQRLFASPMRFSWDEIKEITYKPYELEFHLANDAARSVHLNTTAKTSLAIKQTLREFADEKQIAVAGG